MSGLNISFKISAIDDFSKTMSKLNTDTKKAFDTVGTIGAGMTVAGAGIAAGLGVAVKTAADFESAMSRVGALSGATDKDLSSLTQTAKDLGAATSFSASEAAEGMSYLAMAGYKTNDIIAAMPGLLNAAAAGQTDLATTADITSNILSGFGLEAAETARVADILTKTFTSSNVDLQMLGESMKYVSPTAKAMGLSIEEVSAAVGLLGNAGIQGSMAGTSLSMSLTRLASPTKEAADLMKDLGFNAFDAEGQMLPLNKIIENLQKSTADLTDEQKMHAISTIFGAESMKSMLTLMEAGPEALSAFTKELENSGGTAEEIANKQLDNLNGQLTILKSGLEAAAISIGTALLPVIKFLAAGIQSLVDWFNGLSEPVKTSIAIVAALTAGFLLLMGPILILVAILPSIVAGFSFIAGAVGLASSALLSIIGIVVAVVAALVLIGVGLVAAYNKVGWFRDMVNSAWASIKSAWNTALVFISGLVKTIMTEVSSFFGAQLAKIQAFWNENGALIMKFVKSFMNTVKTDIQAGMQFIKGIFQVVWPIISGLVKIAWGIIKAAINHGLTVVLGLVEVAMKVLEGDWSGAWESIQQIGKDIWHNIEDFFRNIDLVQIGKDIIQGLINGIGSMAGAITSKVKSLASLVPDGLKDFLNIHSPSRLIRDQVGRFIPMGLAEGIDGSLNVVKKAVSGMAAMAVPDVPNQSYASQSIGNGQAQSSVTYHENTPITINYYGNGSEEDALGLVDIIDGELAKRKRHAARISGVKI